MKKIISLLFLLVFSTSSFSQIHDPVKWSTSVEKISDSEFDLIISVTIEEGWHLYSQNVPENGPIATSFNFESNDNYELVAENEEMARERICLQDILNQHHQPIHCFAHIGGTGGQIDLGV